MCDVWRIIQHSLFHSSQLSNDRIRVSWMRLELPWNIRLVSCSIPSGLVRWTHRLMKLNFGWTVSCNRPPRLAVRHPILCQMGRMVTGRVSKGFYWRAFPESSSIRPGVKVRVVVSRLLPLSFLNSFLLPFLILLLVGLEIRNSIPISCTCRRRVLRTLDTTCWCRDHAGQYHQLKKELPEQEK